MGVPREHIGLYRVSRPLMVASSDVAFENETCSQKVAGCRMSETPEPVEDFLGTGYLGHEPRAVRLPAPLPEALLSKGGSSMKGSYHSFHIVRPDAVCEECEGTVRAAQAAVEKHRYWCEVVAMRNPQCKLAALDHHGSDALPPHLRLASADARDR